MNTDGTGALMNVLYGKEIISKMVGGSQAQFLYDAANRIKELENFAQKIRDDFDHDEVGTTCRKCEASHVLKGTNYG